ncbi:conserved hypothetical protein [Ricinus communis]|uniref:Uncharacterized protein n=1 Tax=Ricinus communis TaxID=3988 RepID=B9T3M5_RICCO|nr:conserved hypothetical protein [Ricinus communis]
MATSLNNLIVSSLNDEEPIMIGGDDEEINARTSLCVDKDKVLEGFLTRSTSAEGGGGFNTTITNQI